MTIRVQLREAAGDCLLPSLHAVATRISAPAGGARR
jgi:hypothetical protein